MDEKDRLAMPSEDEAHDMLNGKIALDCSQNLANVIRLFQRKFQYTLSAVGRVFDQKSLRSFLSTRSRKRCHVVSRSCYQSRELDTNGLIGMPHST